MKQLHSIATCSIGRGDMFQPTWKSVLSFAFFWPQLAMCLPYLSAEDLPLLHATGEGELSTCMMCFYSTWLWVSECPLGCVVCQICFEHRSVWSKSWPSPASSKENIKETDSNHSRNTNTNSKDDLSNKVAIGLNPACLVTLSDIESDLHAFRKAIASALTPAAGSNDVEDTKDQERLEIDGKCWELWYDGGIHPKTKPLQNCTSHSSGVAQTPRWSVKAIGFMPLEAYGKRTALQKPNTSP